MEKNRSIFNGSMLFMFIVLFSPLSLNAEHVGPLVTDTAER